MDKEDTYTHTHTHTHTHTYTVEYFSNPTICDNMAGPWRYRAKWNKSEDKYMISLVCGYKNKWTNKYNKNTLIDTENRLVVISGYLKRTGNCNPLQCSCLENPRGRRAWWAAIYGIAQSRTQLKRLSSSKENGVGGWAKWMKGINCMVIDDNYTCGDDHFLECTDIKLWYCISETHNTKYILTTFSEI